MDEEGVVTKNKARLVAKGYRQEGFQFKQDSKGISICQEKYVIDLLKKYDLADSASVKCPMLSTNILGPDESGVSINETLFRDRKSTLGGCQILRGKLVCWSTTKQNSIAMSSAEAEYVAAAGCCAQVLWIKIQLADYDVLYDKVPIFCDNTSAIAISSNPVLQSRIKHIDIRTDFDLPIEEVNAKRCCAILVHTAMNPVSKPKATIDKRLKKKKIPSSSEPKALKDVKYIPKEQVTVTQLAEEPVTDENIMEKENVEESPEKVKDKADEIIPEPI
ncbi:hypothetical protein Tco_0995776 [Tanacetum coccineum]